MARIDEIIKSRLQKRKVLKERQEEPYPVFVKKSHNIKEFLHNFTTLKKEEKQVKLVGRLMSVRAHGGVTFGDLQDSTGKVQVAFRRDMLGEKEYENIEEFIDRGDFVSLEGVPFETKRGEQTLDTSKFKVISKAIRPLPEKWSGLKDVEQRYRKRYLDLLMNPDAREIFEKRAEILKTCRDFLGKNNFIEVETPILQNIPGGASATPFKTHLNALNMDMYLRIAPELYLKRLLVGGMERVYELGRNFRNEGVDYSHNPEFTMLEFYVAYSDYKEGMKMTEKLLTKIVKNIIGETKYTYNEKQLDFATPWERVEFNELLQKYTDINYEDYDFKTLQKKAEDMGVSIEGDVYSKAQVADQIYKKLILPEIHQPTFVIHHPAEMVPLAKPLPESPDYAATFQLVVAGWELVKGYSELNDPVLQKEFFEEQEKLKKQGDEDAQNMDKDFILALEYGMPPALGFGMGIDRLTAFLTGSNALREVILFPTMKPE